MNRNLTTTRSQVFGDVDVGTECRVCGRDVEDGRAKTCSDYCGNLLEAVMGMLNWSSVRRQIIERDDETCQRCGLDYSLIRRAQDHIRGRIETRVPDRLDNPRMDDLEAVDEYDWEAHREWNQKLREYRQVLKERYGDPYEYDIELEVDHIERVADGGHPFDPANLQTLCSECHQEKTASENSGRRTPTRAELNESLFEYVDP